MNDIQKRMMAKRGQLNVSPASAPGRRFGIQSPHGMIVQRVATSVASASIENRPNGTNMSRNPGRK